MQVSRRVFVASSVAAATGGTAGCLRLEGFDGGRLQILITDTVPSGVQAIDRSNPAVSSSEPLRRGLNEVSDPNYYEAKLTRSEYQTLTETLSEFQYYDRTEDPGSTRPSGYYVSFDGEYAVVEVLPLCSDLTGVSMDRGNNSCVTGAITDSRAGGR